MKNVAIRCLMVFLSLHLTAQAQEVMNLYPGKIPGAKATPAEYTETSVTGADGKTRVGKVSKPTLTIYLPAKEKATGAAVLICPGGGYSIVAISHEGYNVAEKFNEIGVAAFVLKYRLPSDEIMTDRNFGPLQDVQQAMYTIRANAEKYNINPAKVGVMGFSAGGHLAASLTVHYRDVKIANEKKLSLRPDFSVLMYPVISFGDVTHAGSKKSLIGADAPAEKVKYFSNETGVDAETPPTFLVHANNDKTVPVENSILFNQAMVKNNVPSELHIFQSGGHGFGLNNKTTDQQWFDMLVSWLKGNKIL
jgi:acetyl esterase/lipase